MSMASLNITPPLPTPFSFSLSSPTQLHGQPFPQSSTPLCSFATLPRGKASFLHGIRNFKTPKLSCSCSLISSISGVPLVADDDDDEKLFIVVNLYHFVYIKDPEFEVSKHISVLEELDIHGRIYFNEQGINAQFSGPSKDALAYVKWLRDDQRFTDILVQFSPSGGHAFPRLKLRYKPSLVQYELGAQDLPLLDPSMRAVPLSPAEWRTRLKSQDSNHDTAHGGQKRCILLDVRNGYEWDIGHFHGAQRPEVDCFKSTSFGLSDLQTKGFQEPFHFERWCFKLFGEGRSRKMDR